ncbi:MAG: carbon-nitrogen hydrolase family protein [Candidatus Gastranaerophilales bacterium]|nr:carbon-nitrogen hydrolase family protein [Candidatus Gastranaerophilales bacterium]
MENKIKIAVVNFKTVWGNKEKNLKSICEYCQKAGEQKTNLIVFPETALTGYDNDKEHQKSEKMHLKLAETIPGKSTEIVSEYAKKYGMYVVFGMAEKSDDKIYNSAAIIYPDGKCTSYRKLHLPFDEKEWAETGEKPELIDSEFGKIGITICYDTYCFPELIRYYRAKGARLILNVTACPDVPCTMGAAKLTLPAYAYTNYVFIASANLCGKEIRSNFTGGSCIIGPDKSKGGYFVYAGKMFGDKDSEKDDLIIGEIDLSLADKYTDIPIFSGDWNPVLYKKLYSEFE